MCTERAPSLPASACLRLGPMSAAEACQDGRRGCGAVDEQHPAAQTAQRSMHGLAGQLATALAARTVGQQLADSLRQALPAARDIRCQLLRICAPAPI